MIIYLHGFDSTSPGNHQKVMQLRFVDPHVQALSYSTIHPKHDMSFLLNEVTREISHCAPKEPMLIIGVGLGGYWSERIGFLCGIPAVMVNPNIHPEKTMVGQIDRIEEFEHIKGKCISNFRELNHHRSLVILSKQDESLNSDDTANELSPYYSIVWDEEQTHKFADLSPYLQSIKAFRQTQKLPYMSSKTG